MTRDIVKTEIEDILGDKTKPREEQIKLLNKMYQELRAQQRAATESAMVDDDELGNELRQVEKALESMNAQPASPEDKGPATL